MKRFGPGLFALLCLAFLQGPSVGQDASPERAAPRKIAPDRFPDYGIRSTQGGQSTLAPPFILEMPTDERPLGACERNMARPDWLRCLRETASLTDDLLSKVASQIKKTFERREMTSVLTSAWSRAIDESLLRWRSLRDYECQYLALAEPGAAPELFEARQVCQIRRNRERAAELKLRYQIDELSKLQNAAP